MALPNLSGLGESTGRRADDLPDTPIFFEQALEQAVKNGHVDIVRALIHNVDVNGRTYAMFLALMETRDPEMVRVLAPHVPIDNELVEQLFWMLHDSGDDRMEGSKYDIGTCMTMLRILFPYMRLGTDDPRRPEPTVKLLPLLYLLRDYTRDPYEYISDDLFRELVVQIPQATIDQTLVGFVDNLKDYDEDDYHYNPGILLNFVTRRALLRALLEPIGSVQRELLHAELNIRGPRE